MLLVLIEAIAPLTIGRQGHSMDEQSLHRAVIFHGGYLALTDITEFSHKSPLLSKGVLMRLVIIVGELLAQSASTPYSYPMHRVLQNVTPLLPSIPIPQGDGTQILNL